MRKVLEFAEGLRPREKANFDPEDTLNELYVKLAERDDKFSPDRGRYVSFAATVAENEMRRIRDRAKTIRPPGNPAARMRDYQARLDEGTLSEKQAGTMSDLRRVMGSPASIEGGESAGRSTGDDRAACLYVADGQLTPDVRVAASERVVLARRTIALGLVKLNIYEAGIVGEAFGLWGRPVVPIADIASARHRSVATIRRQLDTALAVCQKAIQPEAA